MTGNSAPHVCLCVPTFRRPEGLRNLLAHIARLTCPGRLEVVVVENDAEVRAGAEIVAAAAPGFPLPLTCVVEPRRGQTYAYNRAFAIACHAAPRPDYVAVLDDDEYPAANWLIEIVRVALEFNVDIVGGPVFPVFDSPDHWLAKSGLYAPPPYATGRVPMIYGSGNMLIKCSVLEQYLDEPFRHAFAFTGGSDEEFFWRCRRDGRSFAWADAAHVFETTPQSRTTVRYLLRRRFRVGTGATRVERQFSGTAAGAAKRWFKGLGLLSIGILSLPLAAFGGRRGIVRSLIRAAQGAGRIAAEFGILYEEYR
jgi:glycosyltransferase involved in cell wall biosynthesis